MDAGFHVTILTIRYLGIDISLGKLFHCHNIKKPSQTFSCKLYYYIVSIIMKRCGLVLCTAPQNVDP
jgi:hypothetical protein